MEKKLWLRLSSYFSPSLSLTSFRTRTSGTSSLVETFLRLDVAKRVKFSATALTGLLMEAPGLPDCRAFGGVAEAILGGPINLGLVEE